MCFPENLCHQERFIINEESLVGSSGSGEITVLSCEKNENNKSTYILKLLLRFNMYKMLCTIISIKGGVKGYYFQLL